jgi:hypothetical protein
VEEESETEAITLKVIENPITEE